MFIQSPLNRHRRSLLIAGAVSAVLPVVDVRASALSTNAFADHVMLSKPWLPTLNVAEFLVSEKLDGVRALWDGSTLRFRSGRPITAPDWFLHSLPAQALDGELWLGRRSFDMLSGVVRKDVPVDAEWRSVRYMVFDAPQHALPFAKRAERVRDLLEVAPQPWLQALAHTRVANAAALQVRLNEVVASGGEGLVLHRADALWSAGRSDALRKLKPVPDEEGVVLAHIPGKGKFDGLMGALLLQTPQGQRFALGTGFSDTLRATPPAVGSVVIYRYRDRTASGLPKFASFLRMGEIH